ncbi:DPP IV N-terminal domain-containing protein [Chitinophagaceae bacterium LB-8]|uniref:DPP IV N-terminal domain-containing protein n=1 Tax=Paraflavisolibacter caeni TaxID=2982496 RepID=A0A9X2XYK0_9BACT|nr:DPP IV N-terminal domain-containing protein [Paraflavisolibacter caeni]MCU7551251.1 DPP IV N-terminal domain-containing protein [Paraflavisolibacter caeni]
MSKEIYRFLLFWFVVAVVDINPVHSQYFGRNKVNYRRIDFKVLETPNFEIYYYLQNGTVRDRIALQCEQWYQMHQTVLKDTFKRPNPVIFYNNHADFQQTRAIEGNIEVGTGGVTEALKRRVIMPFMESNAQTDHVLGHELVHAFQYHLILDSLTMDAIANLPLWMVEGMAEYMSIGYQDAHTAIWLRSAVAGNRMPTLKDLTNHPDLYFPYRWGEAFWAFVAGTWGEQMIKRLFMRTARDGYENAIKEILGIDAQKFSEKWQEALRRAYTPYQRTTSTYALGKKLVVKHDAGELNIVPSISPDGSRVAFWTERNLFRLDLYVADAETGDNLERVTSHSFTSHVDEYSSFESSVAWSPDSRQLAFVAFAKGSNRLIIARADKGRIMRQIDIPGVPAISNPTWSPDGKSIVVTGLVDGQSDLYLYQLESGKVIQLTNDRYSDLQPSYAPNGKWIVFATDRLSVDYKPQQHSYNHNIALYNFESKSVTNLDFFPGANNLNPVFGPDNQEIYFLSDRDGFRNLYSYNIYGKRLYRLTNYFTGITGVTMFAPAISASRQQNKVAYTYYNNNAFLIYTAPIKSFNPVAVDTNAVNMQAAILPPFARTGLNLVQRNLTESPVDRYSIESFNQVSYKPRFQLDYIGNTGVGVTTGLGFGIGLVGGINGMFSDILGNNQLFGAISLNGELYDIAGQFAYLNQKNRINWGVSVSHTPYLSGAQYLFLDTLESRGDDPQQVLNSSMDLLRTFEDQISVFASRPFSQSRRVEAGLSYARYYYRMDRYTDYYDPTGQIYIDSKRERQTTPKGYGFSQGYIAWVSDNSSFGVASPLSGHRFRFEAGKYLGVVNLQNLLADYRKYFRFAPVTLATRNLYVARFGRDAESGLLPPLYVGYSSLVRGYEALQFADNGDIHDDVTINDLIGSSMYVANAELRYPLTGPERLSSIKSRFFLSELNMFTDAGIAWGKSNIVGGFKNIGFSRNNAQLIMSSGISLRINLFGYIVLEPFYAIPWQNGGFSNGDIGLNFIPGW